MARTSDFHWLDVFRWDDDVLPHLCIRKEVVGEQPKERFARRRFDIQAIRQLGDSLQKGRMLVVQLADIDGTGRSVTKHGVHKLHIVVNGLLRDVHH